MSKILPKRIVKIETIDSTLKFKVKWFKKKIFRKTLLKRKFLGKEKCDVIRVEYLTKEIQLLIPFFRSGKLIMPHHTDSLKNNGLSDFLLNFSGENKKWKFLSEILLHGCMDMLGREINMASITFDDLDYLLPMDMERSKLLKSQFLGLLWKLNCSNHYYFPTTHYFNRMEIDKHRIDVKVDEPMDIEKYHQFVSNRFLTKKNLL